MSRSSTSIDEGFLNDDRRAPFVFCDEQSDIHLPAVKVSEQLATGHVVADRPTADRLRQGTTG